MLFKNKCLVLSRLFGADIYRGDEVAFRLRSMHLLNGGIKEADSTMVAPSAYVDGFTEEAARESRRNGTPGALH